MACYLSKHASLLPLLLRCRLTLPKKIYITSIFQTTRLGTRYWVSSRCSLFVNRELIAFGIVYGSYTIEVVQTAMTSADLYFWYYSPSFLCSPVFDCSLRFATGYGNVTHLGNVNISPVDTPVLCGIIAAIVQCFFAYRIFTLRRSYLWICVLIVLVNNLYHCFVTWKSTHATILSISKTSIVQTVGALATAFRVRLY